MHQSRSYRRAINIDSQKFLPQKKIRNIQKIWPINFWCALNKIPLNL